MNIQSLTHADWMTALNDHEICPHDLIESLIEENCKFLWHPLGFVMCKVVRWESTSLRVHIWPNDTNYQQTPAWLIHDHLFHLKSWVLSGEIENKEYLIDINGTGNVIYEAQYDGDCSILNRTNIFCSRSLNKKAVYSKGTVYEVPSGIFHESRSLSKKTTVTVCETYDEVAAPPKILGSVDGALSYTYERRNVTERQMLELIRNI